MAKEFNQVKEYLMELGYSILKEDKLDQVFIIDSEIDGIKNLVVSCSEPILIMEQFLFEVTSKDHEIYKTLLIKNRDLVHGALALNEEGTKVLFRDTLQLNNLDLNELEASINSLSLLLSEFSDEIITFSKQ